MREIIDVIMILAVSATLTHNLIMHVRLRKLVRASREMGDVVAKFSESVDRAEKVIADANRISRETEVPEETHEEFYRIANRKGAAA